MEFGKLADISQVDFIIPPINSYLTPVTTSTVEGKPKIYVGTAQWGEKTLLGKIYPRGTAQKDYLYYYTRQFETVEMNTTHYRIPTPAIVAKWCGKAAPAFRFCPKIPQVISHSPDFGETKRVSSQFFEALYAFGSQLGLPFMQLPPSFNPYRDGKRLFNYLEKWPHDLPLAIEFRHKDWFADDKITRRTFELLREYNLSTVITDTAGRRDAVHMQMTNDRQAVRFVGNSLHPTDYSRIDTWINRIEHWFDNGLQELYFFVHQPEEHLCVDLSVYLIEQINTKLDLGIPIPKVVQNPAQQSLF